MLSLNVRKLFAKAVENWPVKIISIALALILFIFHRMNTLATRPLSVPLTIETDAALIPASPFPQNIRVNLRGEDAGIRSILDSDLEAFVDLSMFETGGWYRAPVQVRKKGSALNVEPLEITVNPIEISVQLDRRTGRTFPLEAVTRGKVSSGFDMVSYSISPAEIVVTGPSGVMETISVLYTEPVDLDGRNADFRVMVNIVSPNQFFVFQDGGMAEFSAVVRQLVTVRNFDGIPVTITGLDDRFTAYLGGRTGSVRLEGDQNRLDVFEPPPDFLIINCSNITMPGTFFLPIEAEIPAGFSLIRIEPETMIITITLKEDE